MAGALPPLPKIEGDVDLFLDVFTHNSLRMESAPMNEEYGNTDRLAELGASTLKLAVATHFFRQKPLLSADEIAVSVAGATPCPLANAFSRSKLRNI